MLSNLETMTNDKTVVVSTDGSALSNPNGPMGWAWADHQGGDADAGGASNGTNQIGELCAVLQALRAHPGSDSLVIQTDSQYAINCSSKWVHGWKKKGWKNAAGKPVKNRQLIEAIDKEIRQREGSVTFVWVKGHAGDAFNEKVDSLARGYAESAKNGGRTGCLPIEGWQSLLCSDYTQGLQVPDEVQQELDGGPAVLDARGRKRGATSSDDRPLSAEEEEMEATIAEAKGSSITNTQSQAEQPPENDSDINEQAEPEGQDDLKQSADAVPDERNDDPPAQAMNAQVPDSPESTEPDMACPPEEDGAPSSAEPTDTPPTSRGLLTEGEVVITPPPSQSPSFAGHRLHITGSIEIDGYIDQEGRVVIDQAPFRLHGIEIDD